MSVFARAVYASLMWRGARRARLARGLRRKPERAVPDQHLLTGRRGESLAYWYLRSEGYTMVARNLRLRPDAGELDLVGWDGSVLAFVEVKTRVSLEAGLPEEAVTEHQRKRIAQAATGYIRRLKRKELNYRFDIVSVIWDDLTGFHVKLIKDAFRPGGGWPS